MKYLLIAAGLILAASCSPKTSATVEPVEKSLSADALAGQTLYSENCGKCHDLPKVSAYSEERWNEIMPRMAKKAHFTPEQEKQATAYVMETLK